jgi:type VI protein secretion system component VasK
MTELTIHHIFGRLKRRAIGAALLVLFAVIAVYQITVAGTLGLEAEYGILYARVIMAAIYTAAALSVLIVLWVTRTKPPFKAQTADALMSPRDTQIAALIEAALLGYVMARKSADRKH